MNNLKIKTDSTALWLDDQPILTTDLVNTLRKEGRITALVKELVLNHALAEICLKPGREDELLEEFRSQKNLEKEESFNEFLTNNFLDEALFRQILSRPSKILEFRDERWGTRINSIYLKHKNRYDLVTYKCLQHNNYDVMQEAFFRLKDHEESWERMFNQFEEKTPGRNGLMNSIPIDQLEPALLTALRNATPGKIIRPIQINNQMTIIAELIKFESQKLDDSLRAKILNREMEEWIAEECRKIFKKIRFSK